MFSVTHTGAAPPLPVHRPTPLPPGPEVTVPRVDRRLWLPLAIALAWALGTSAARWLTPPAGPAPERLRLVLFVLIASAIFATGYALRLSRCPDSLVVGGDPPGRGRRADTLVTWVGCCHLALAAVLLVGAGPPARIRVLLTVLLTVLCAVLIPYLVLYWRRLGAPARILGLAGLAAHALHLLHVGAVAGIGHLVAMTVASALVAALGTWHRRARRDRRDDSRRRGGATVPVLAALLAAGAPLALGWLTGGADRRWSTLHPWLAAEPVLPGVLVLPGLLGWIFAHLWVAGAIQRRPLAVPLLVQMCVGIAYLPAADRLGPARSWFVAVVAVAALVLIHLGGEWLTRAHATRNAVGRATR